MTSFPRWPLAFALLVCLSACVTTVDLPYGGGAPFSFANPVLAIGRVTDKRDDEPNYLGTIRGGFGNPLTTLETNRPVAELVARAFAQALAQRGLLASPQTERYDLDLTLLHLDGNQVVRREAFANFALSVRDRATGAVVYADEVSVRNRNGSLGYLLTLQAGVGGSVSELHLLTVLTMNQAINQALDKPGFLAVVAAPPA